MKVYNFLILTLGIMILLELAGINVTGLDLSVFGLGTTSSNLSGSNFYIFLIAALSVALGGGIIVGFITGGKPENYVILPIIIFHLVVIVKTWHNLLVHGFAIYPGWISALIVAIFGPLCVGFILSLAEFFRGTD